MSNKGKQARQLIEAFLEENFQVDDNEIGLRYQNGKFYQWANGCYSEQSDEEVKTRFTRWATKKQIRNFNNTKAAAEEALHHIKSKIFLPPTVKKNTYIDVNEDSARYLAFENGVVDMNTVLNRGVRTRVDSHTPNFFNLAKIPYSFDESAKCSTWLKIIRTSLPEKEDQKLLQQWFGYHLIPGLSRTKMMFMEGHGANGKSVILLVLRLMLGEENVSSVPLSAFDPQKPFRIASTDGMLANICEEAGQISSAVEEAIKQFVNGGAFTVERKFRDPFQMYPTAKITVATNSIPEFKDKTDGIWRRILYLKFKVTIPLEQQNREYLEREYWLNSGELQGVLNWALTGAQDLESNEFVLSERKKEEIRSLKMNSDLIRAWVTDHFVEAPGCLLPTADISKRLQIDSDYGLIPRVGLREVYREIEARFPNCRRPSNAMKLPDGRRARVFEGVKLVDETQETQEEDN